MPRFLGWLLLATSARLLADGGMVLMHQQTPPFAITVFASPTPPRAGLLDLSVLLQSSETLEPVLDADVNIELTKNGSRVQARATRDHAQNKLLYAASVQLGDPGEWRYTVSVRTATAPVTFTGVIAVATEQPKLAAYWSYLVLPFLCLAIFALHQSRTHTAKRTALCADPRLPETHRT
jgi:hypothetical protein